MFHARAITLIILCAACFFSVPFASASVDYHLTVDLGGHGTVTMTEIMPEFSVLPSGSSFGYGVASVGVLDGLEEGWFIWGAVVEVVISSDVGSNSSTTRYLYDWATGVGDGAYTGSDAVFRVTMNSDIDEKIGWLTQYLVTFARSGLGVDVVAASTVVVVDGVPKMNPELPFSTWKDADGLVSYSYSSIVTGASGYYDWASTGGLGQTLRSNAFNVVGSGTVTGTYTARGGPTTVTTTVTTTIATTIGTPSLELSPLSVGTLLFTLEGWGAGSIYGVANIAIALLAILMIVVLLVWRRRRNE
jgi:hypothetical protein